MANPDTTPWRSNREQHEHMLQNPDRIPAFYRTNMFPAVGALLGAGATPYAMWRGGTTYANLKGHNLPYAMLQHQAGIKPIWRSDYMKARGVGTAIGLGAGAAATGLGWYSGKALRDALNERRQNPENNPKVGFGLAGDIAGTLGGASTGAWAGSYAGRYGLDTYGAPALVKDNTKGFIGRLMSPITNPAMNKDRWEYLNANRNKNARGRMLTTAGGAAVGAAAGLAGAKYLGMWSDALLNRGTSRERLAAMEGDYRQGGMGDPNNRAPTYATQTQYDPSKTHPAYAK